MAEGNDTIFGLGLRFLTSLISYIYWRSGENVFTIFITKEEVSITLDIQGDIAGGCSHY